MSDNKAVKEQMIKLYGPYCMMCVLKGKEQLSKMKALTYHHIIPKNRYKNKGIKGPTTIGNGALLCRNCHTELENKPEEEREELNKELVNYKKRFPDIQISVAQISNGKVVKAELLVPEDREEPVYIPVYDTTPEEYEKYLEARRKKEREKPIWQNHKFNEER